MHIPFKRFAADLITNIGSAVFIAIVVGVGSAIMVYLGPAWAKPLTVGGLIALFTLLIILAVKAIRLLPAAIEPTTRENIQERARDWLDAFSLTVTKSKPPNTHFRLDVVTNGRSIAVMRPVDGDGYLHFFAKINPDTDDKQVLAVLSESEKAATTIALKLELARARMGYLGFSLEGFTIFKRMAIKPDLNESSFIEGIWEIEAMLNALFMVAASTNIRNQEVVKLVAARKESSNDPAAPL